MNTSNLRFADTPEVSNVARKARGTNGSPGSPTAHDARRCINGANVQRLKEMIFAYEQAVYLHNREWPSHHVYQPQPEITLRSYVVEHQLMDLDRRVIAARRYAETLVATSARLHRKIEELDAMIEGWKTSGDTTNAD